MYFFWLCHLHLLFGCILSTLNKDVMMMMMIYRCHTHIFCSSATCLKHCKQFSHSLCYIKHGTISFRLLFFCVFTIYQKDIEALDKVQKGAIKILPQIEHMKYSGRLKAFKLPTLHYRRIWGLMIETYKILTGKYDIETAPSLVGVCSSVTRGHSLRLQKIGENMISVSFVLLIE